MEGGGGGGRRGHLLSSMGDTYLAVWEEHLPGC